MWHKVEIIGKLSKPPQMRYTPTGQAVTNLDIPANHTYTLNGQKVKETVWFRVTVWGTLAENCNTYLDKGSQVLVIGRLKPDESGNPRTFTRKDGTAGASYEITASEVKFLSTRENGGEQHDAPFENNDEPPF